MCGSTTCKNKNKSTLLSTIFLVLSTVLRVRCAHTTSQFHSTTFATWTEQRLHSISFRSLIIIRRKFPHFIYLIYDLMTLTESKHFFCFDIFCYLCNLLWEIHLTRSVFEFYTVRYRRVSSCSSIFRSRQKLFATFDVSNDEQRKKWEKFDFLITSKRKRVTQGNGS